MVYWTIQENRARQVEFWRAFARNGGVFTAGGDRGFTTAPGTMPFEGITVKLVEIFDVIDSYKEDKRERDNMAVRQQSRLGKGK